MLLQTIYIAALQSTMQLQKSIALLTYQPVYRSITSTEFNSLPLLVSGIRDLGYGAKVVGFADLTFGSSRQSTVDGLLNSIAYNQIHFGWTHSLWNLMNPTSSADTFGSEPYQDPFTRRILLHTAFLQCRCGSSAEKVWSLSKNSAYGSTHMLHSEAHTYHLVHIITTLYSTGIRQNISRNIG